MHLNEDSLNWIAFQLPFKGASHYWYQSTLNRLKMAHQIGTKMAFGTDIIINLPDMNRLESNLQVLKTWKESKCSESENYSMYDH